MESITSNIKKSRYSYITALQGKIPTQITMNPVMFQNLVDELFSYIDVLDSAGNRMSKNDFIKSESPTIFGMKIIKNNHCPLLNFHIN